MGDGLPTEDQRSSGHAEAADVRSVVDGQGLFDTNSIKFVFAGSVLGRIATAMISLGIVLLVQDATGSFAIAGFATGAFTLGVVLAGPARSHLIVKFGNKRVLVLLALIAVLGLMSLPVFAHNTVLAVSIAAAVGVASPPFGAMLRVGWSAILPRFLLPRAFGLDSVCEEISLVVGLLLVGAATAIGGPPLPLVISGVIVITSAMLMAPGLNDAKETEEMRSSVGSIARGALPILCVLTGVGLTVGLVEVAVPALAANLGRIDHSGTLLAVLSAASAVGAFAYGRLRLRFLRGWMIWLGVATAFGTVLLVFATNVGMLAGLLVIAGFAVGPAVITGYLLADAHAKNLSGKTHAAILASAACNGGTAAGAAVAGLLISFSDPVMAILVISCLALVLALVGGMGLPKSVKEGQ